MNCILNKSKEELVEYIIVLNSKLKQQSTVLEKFTKEKQLDTFDRVELFEFAHDTKKYLDEMKDLINKLIERA